MARDGPSPLRFVVNSHFYLLTSCFKVWGRRRDLHSRGANARRFTKPLLSLLSHVGIRMRNTECGVRK
jgi:hypothetical protein